MKKLSLPTAGRSSGSLGVVAMLLLLAASAPAARADGELESGPAVRSDISPPLRSLPAQPPGNDHANPVRRRPTLTGEGFDISPPDLRRQATAAPGTLISTEGTWEGVNNVNGVIPPDANGDVGLHDYVQWVNLSFRIWSKSGVSRYGPAAGNTLWAGFGGTCQTTNQGDPVVLYDRQANRWVFSQFAFTTKGNGSTVPPYYQCFAVSTTGDPTGSYYRYAFRVNPTTDYFPDYPKFGVWGDAYYMSTNNFGKTFAGPGAFAFDRTKMLAGDPTASFVGFQLPATYEGLLPSNATGATPPPAGTPNYFAAVDTAGTGTGSTFQIWKLHADFATPANSTLTGPVNVPVSPYKYAFCGSTSSPSCIPQPGTTRTLDPLADRLMNRLDYRNFGDHEALVASHTVNVGSGSANQAGVRWYEIRAPGTGSPEVYQQGTFAPADGVNRWMGSAALDGDGDMALGYSASSASVFPSIRVTGRLADDPLGTMPQGEQTIVAGGGSQTGYSRWGDYSAMSADPVDDSTFWYTQEYYAGTSSAGWQTRIGSFRLRPAPPVTLASPSDSSFAASSPTFQGTASTAAGDSDTVTVKVYAGSALAGTPVETLTTTRDGGGGWSVPASPPLGDGVYTVQAQQAGAGGNTGYSTANGFTVDATPPAPTLTAPADGALTNDSTPTFQGTAGTAAGDSTTVTVTVYSGATVVQTLPTTRSGGTWAVTASPALPDGTYTAQAQQTDAAGNTGTTAVNTLTVDTAAPAVTLTAPAAGSAPDTTPTFEGTAGTAAGDSASVTVKVYAGTSASGTAAPALAQGTYTARAQQSDSATNLGFSAPRTFTVDSVAPVVALTAPADGALTNDSTPTFQGTAGTAAGDSTTVTVTVYSGATVVETLPTTRSGGTWAVTASPALPDGTYTAQAQQTDAAGNTGTSAVRTFTVDATAPAVTLTAPAAGSATPDTTPTFEGSAGTAAGDSASVTVKVYAGTSASGTPVQTLGATRQGDGSWTVTAAPALAQGTYTARAQQSDSATNLGFSAPRTFTVDSVAPVVALTAPANASSSTDTTPTFQGTAGTAAGDASTVTVRIYSGATEVETLAAARDGAGSWSVTAAPALGLDTYTVRAEQGDSAGNTGFSAVRTFTIAAPPPPNQPPTAAFTFLPGSPLPAQVVTFDGAGSSDPDGTIATYAWLFGDGAGAADAQPTHTYAAAGDYTVQLTVTDNSGGTGAAAAPITVQSPPAAPGPAGTPPPAEPEPGPGPSPQLPTAPSVSLRVPRQKLGPVVARGLVLLVTSDTPGAAQVRLVVAGRTARRLGLSRGRQVTIGRASKAIATAGTPERMVVKLTARARRALARRRKLTMTIKLSVSDLANATSTPLQQKLTLRR
jgi:hypothetical protein